MKTRLAAPTLRTGGVLILFALVLRFPKGADTNLRAQNRIGAVAAEGAASTFCNRLLKDYPEVLDGTSESEINAAAAERQQGDHLIWLTDGTRTSMTAEQARENLEKSAMLTAEAAKRMAAAVERIPGLIRLPGQASISRAVSVPFRSAVLVVSRRTTSELPEFTWKKVDLSAGETVAVDLGAASDVVGALELIHPPRSSGRFQLKLAAGGKTVGEIALSVTTPPQFRLQVEIVDDAGRPTEAAVGLYAPPRKLLVPPGALDFSTGGYSYQAVSYREHHAAKFWPGGRDTGRSFFVKGGFALDLPAGKYRLIAAKGPEYLAVDLPVNVGPDNPNSAKVTLRRWTNMSERGWHSGDTHIHYARAGQEANQRLALWAQAEDLEMGNILRMGDGRKTYFEQYAFGQAGRYVYSKGAFVAGQEDPRTGVMGHTISLNLQSAVRYPERGYYLYSKVFDEAHRQGGLTGYAHVGTADFLVYRDMTLNIARQKADFAEISQSGRVGTELYYEFLNLGFRLTASGGSDAPWGGTVGESRVYAYTGGKLDTDQWFAAVKNGHTFVTAAPMLEFTVDGHLPGDRLSPQKGKKLKVHALAQVGSPDVPLGRLEIVANGDVVRSVEPAGTSAKLDFELPADQSIWIAARATGAHTTPVYITVDGKRHWKLPEVSALLDKRFRDLDELDRVIDKDWENIPPRREGGYENKETFRLGASDLRPMIQEAREIYLKLREEARSQMAGTEGSK